MSAVDLGCAGQIEGSLVHFSSRTHDRHVDDGFGQVGGGVGVGKGKPGISLLNGYWGSWSGWWMLHLAGVLRHQ